MQQKRTAIFSLLDTPAFGGAEQYMLQHLFYLSQQGYNIILATNNAAVKNVFENHRKQQKIDTASFKIIDAPYLLDAIGNFRGLMKYFVSLPLACFWLLRTLLTLKKQYQQIIALLPGFSDRLSFSPLISWLRCKLIWIEIGPLEPTFKKNFGFPKMLYRLTQSFPDHFVTTSKWTKQSMVKTGKIDPKCITLIYPGITPFTHKKITFLKQIGKQWKKEQKVARKKIICFLGRMANENQVDLVIKAFASINKQLPDWHLVIIGDGPEKKRYQSLVSSLKIHQQITFTGFIDEEQKYSILAASDIFVFTRSWDLDGFGMTTIEAMSVGLPVINPTFGPQKEITQHNQTGLQFTPNNVASLAKNIQKLASHPQLRKKVGQTGQKHAIQNFSNKIWLQKMHHCIKTVSKQANSSHT